MRKTASILACLALLLVACADDVPPVDEPDAAPPLVDACPSPTVPAWRAIECRVLCGSVELDAPALCAGTDSFGDCHRECVTMAPAGHYCPLGPVAAH